MGADDVGVFAESNATCRRVFPVAMSRILLPVLKPTFAMTPIFGCSLDVSQIHVGPLWAAAMGGVMRAAGRL